MNNIIISNKKPIVIGRQGENQVTTIKFSIDSLFPHIRNATYGLVHQRHGDAAPYPVTTMAIGGYVNWVINSADVGKVGNGTAQLTAYKDGAVAKSIIFTTITLTSMGTTDAPDPVQIYIDRVVRAGQEAVNAAADAEESAEGAASSAEAAAASAEAAAGSAEAAQQILDDIPGTVEAELAEAKESGEFDGPRGYSVYGGSSVVIANWTDGTHTENYCVDKVDAPDAGIGDFILGKRHGDISLMKVVREDANHLFGDGVMDLIGQMGQDGEDGYSPTVSVTTITGGHRVTITDASGAHSFDVMDGEDGTPTKISDLVNDVGNTVWGGTSGLFAADTVTEDGRVTGYSFDRTFFPKAVVNDLILGAEPFHDFAAIFRIKSIENDKVICEAPALQVSGPYIPSGGTTGQVLRKKSNNPYDVEWAT